MEELNLGPPNTNPSSGREEDSNPGPPDYKSSALTTRPRRSAPQEFSFTFRSFFPELQALAELLGAYGMKHLGHKMMQQIASQVGEIKVFKHIFLVVLEVKINVDDVVENGIYVSFHIGAISKNAEQNDTRFFPP